MSPSEPVPFPETDPRAPRRSTTDYVEQVAAHIQGELVTAEVRAEYRPETDHWAFEYYAPAGPTAGMLRYSTITLTCSVIRRAMANGVSVSEFARSFAAREAGYEERDEPEYTPPVRDAAIYRYDEEVGF